MRAWRPISAAARRTLRQANTRPFSCSRVSLAANEVRSVADLLQGNEGVNSVRVDGWVRSVRKQKRIAFVTLSDGTTIDPLQAVLTPEDAAELSYGTAVSLEGDWKPSQGAKQSYELHTNYVSIEGGNDAEKSPLQPKFQTAEYLRAVPHLRSRVPSNALLLRLRSRVIASLTQFFNEEGFIQTHTPIITSSDCEGAGEVFTVSSNASKDSEQRSKAQDEAQVEHFFRQPKYLTVSAQLHLEALAQAVNKVWTLSPTFRAEKSDTSRHLSEFYMLEAEQCFLKDVSEVISLVERMLRAIAFDLRHSKVGMELLQARRASAAENDESESSATTAEELQRRWDGMAMPRWRRMTYEQAISELRQSGFNVEYGDSLSAEHERTLANLDKHRTPLFVTDYPREQKPFYMAPSGHGGTVACFDLLVPDLCELVGGSMREHRSQDLVEAMRNKGVEGKNLEWYQDLRKYGSVSHGGFGLGFDRLLCYLSGVSSIRDVVAFPRWYGRCDC